MFLSNYLKDYNFEQIISVYRLDYLNQLNESNFIKIYQLFIDLGFYYIEDIILKYLEIFDLPYDLVSDKLNYLKSTLGDNYITLIGENLTYLDMIWD